jgi:hypothetical protein
MSDNPAIEVAKDLVRQLPAKQVYEDGLQQPVQQIGSIATDLLKTVHLALAPIQLTAALQDRFRTFVNRAVRQVPEERQVAPPPQILGPVLEGIKYEPEGTPIDEMFAELLSRGMDKDRVQEAHPAFPAIIRQLSADEAILITLVHSLKRFTVQTFVRYNPNCKSKWQLNKRFSKAGIAHPGNISFYLDHLSSLGLTRPVKQEPMIPTKHKIGLATFGRTFETYTMTEFGGLFATACVPSVSTPQSSSLE